MRGMAFSVSDLERALALQPAVRRWVVAYSGGLDSTVLLHALVALKLPAAHCALHINHQLSPHSHDWQRHCAAFCARLNTPFCAATVQVERDGSGIEAAARRARYSMFERFLQPGDCLLQAHHLDDQAETLLLRLLRGSGPRGLAAIRAARELGRGRLYRPLLAVGREQLHAYARAQQLSWIDDESNLDTRFDRNYLRREVLPLLQRRWPDYRRRFQQAAALCAATDQLNRDTAAADLAALGPRAERLGASIDLHGLRAWPQPRRNNVLRYWFSQRQLPLPELVHLQQLQRQILDGGCNSSAQVAWGEVVLRCYGDRLFCLPRLPAKPVSAGLRWALRAPLALPAGGSLAAVPAAAGAGRLRLLEEVEVRHRGGGERCRPHDRNHSQTLKKLLQERRLEPWLRDRVPLIYVGPALAAVGDLWVCKDFTAPPGEPGLRLDWRFD